MSFWSRIERRLTDLANELIPDEYRAQVLTARVLLEEGRAAEAAETLEALLTERPEHPGALELLGIARLALGDARGARAAFEGALELRPNAPEGLVGQGEACLGMGEWEPAIGAFRAAVREAAGDRAVLAVAYRGLGLAFRQRGELDKAIRELRKAVTEDPTDVLARAALGEALLADADGSAEEARTHLTRALEGEAPPPVARLALGRLALDDGLADEAREQFELVLEQVGDRDRQRRADALLGLGDAALLGNGADAAIVHYRDAEAAMPRRPDVHARIGDALVAGGRFDEALGSYQRALDLGAEPAVRGRALEAAVRAERVEPIVRLANEALEADPTDRRALVARAVALVAEGQYEPARATFRAALEQGEDIDAYLGLGRITLAEAAAAGPGEGAREAGARAAGEALAALRIDPADERARGLLAAARALELGRVEATEEAGAAHDAGEMYRLAMELAQLFAARAELAGLTAEAAQAAADFDRPLLVTVMGEFSSGKSTFVNAFIGADVAPTGITPTTATINVVKYGRERGGRIVYRDGHTETLGWDALFPALRALDSQRVRSIEVVEILLPLEQLERINLVDTPGLNSILPEHEEVARGFIARADAVVWLFTAGQAGKKSERLALETIGGAGKRVLGVLNKVDQLGDEQAREVVEYIQGELSELVEVVVPISARQALDRADPAADGRDGNWGALAAALEERFLAQARDLKRQACTRRLAALIERATETAGEQRRAARAASDALSTVADEARAAGERFIDEVVARQRREIGVRLSELYRSAAREVLELVLPRRLPFGSHQATVADRDYLIGLLDSGYEAALERSRREVVAYLRQRAAVAVRAVAEVAALLGADAAADLARTAEDAVRLVEAQVYARTRAFLRGYLRGGYVDAFFRNALPKLELDETSVYHALFRNSPDVDAEISLPLAAAGMEALDSLTQRLAHWAGVAEVMACDVEAGVLSALEAIDRRRRTLDET